MTRLAIVADDLSGAADTAAIFASLGLTTLILLATDPPLPADVLAVSTESRHLSASQAAARVGAAAVRLAAARGSGELWIYKKIDSTLRGHPGAELAALMDVLGGERALVAPAFPAQGRTTERGHQLVDGIPLEQTPFSREVGSSEVASVLATDGLDRPLTAIPLEVVHEVATLRNTLATACRGVHVADAVTDRDLIALAEVAVDAGICLLCGSAGLARALAGVLPLAAEAPAPVVSARARGPALIVAASRHPRTVRQVDACREAGCALLTPAVESLTGDRLDDGLVTAAVEALNRGQHVLVTTVGLDRLQVPPATIATRLAGLVRIVLQRSRPGALVVTGGDAAAAVATALDANALWLEGDLRPGIPWSVLVGGVQAGLPFVTKAGGFGEPDALLRAAERFRH